MQNSNHIKDHKGKIAMLVIVAVFSIISSKKADYTQGYNFPKPDPSRGAAWGYDPKTKDYRYESHWHGPLPKQVKPSAKDTTDYDSSDIDNIIDDIESSR